VRVRPILFSLGAVAIVSLAVWALEPFAPVVSLGVLYLFAVLPVAALWGLRYAVPVSIVSMLTFNWFFLPPTHTLQLHDSENWVALAVYLVTAVSVSWLAARRRSLEREDVAKTAVLRSVSHDLRSPITAILTASEVAAGDVSDAERDELLGSIRTQAARLDRLVANVLDLSRLEAGAAAPELEVWPVDSLVARALEALGPAGEKVDAALPEEPLAVRVDAAQLERVLVNLLENALKVSTDVTVSVASTNGDVVFRVADGGPGIPSDDRDVIFEPFARGASANGSRGAGLGLAIARGFLEVNGGRIWLEPDDVRGATFAFALPSVSSVGSTELPKSAGAGSAGVGARSGPA
jgi:two-component system, OmpR family, sensor histidine kinase KdpD